MHHMRLYIATGFANVFERYTKIDAYRFTLVKQKNRFMFNPDEKPPPWKTRSGVWQGLL